MAASASGGRHPFVRLASDGWEYGIYYEGGRKPDQVLGAAPTREEAWSALLTVLRNRLARFQQLAALCFGAAAGCFISGLL